MTQSPVEIAAPPRTRSSSNVVALAPRLEERWETRDDDALMRLARDGVRRAFDEIVRRYQVRALRLAIRELGSRSLAEDVVQNTFVALYRYLPRYRAEGRLGVFLFRILINQCRMQRRSNASRVRGEARLANAPSAVSALPEDGVLALERRRAVTRALEALSPRLRAAVLLRYASELSYADIAEVLQVPLGTVKSRIYAGLRRLRVALEAEADL